MLNTVSLSRVRSESLNPYLRVYISAAAALASITFVPGLIGALLGVGIWLVGMVSLASLVKERINRS